MKVQFFAYESNDKSTKAQAAFRSMLGFFLPQGSFSWRRLGEMTAKFDDKDGREVLFWVNRESSN